MNGTYASVRYPDLSLSNCSNNLLATSSLFLATAVKTLGLDQFLFTLEVVEL
jgi:hypothetical protein